MKTVRFKKGVVLQMDQITGREYIYNMFTGDIFEGNVVSMFKESFKNSNFLAMSNALKALTHNNLIEIV